MAAPRVSFDNSLQRERSRQKRKAQGGKNTELSDRLTQHDNPYGDITWPQPPTKVLKEEQPLIQQECDQVVDDLLAICRQAAEGDNAVKYPNTLQPGPLMHQQPSHLCPFHGLCLELKTSKGGWDYYRCPIAACPFCCGVELQRRAQ